MPACPSPCRAARRYYRAPRRTAPRIKEPQKMCWGQDRPSWLMRCLTRSRYAPKTPVGNRFLRSWLPTQPPAHTHHRCTALSAPAGKPFASKSVPLPLVVGCSCRAHNPAAPSCYKGSSYHDPYAYFPHLNTASLNRFFSSSDGPVR